MNEIKEGILKCLVYYDLFGHPLSKKELYLFTAKEANHIEVEKELTELLQDEVVFEHQDFYSLNKDNKTVNRRIKAQEKALSLMKKAMTVGDKISRLPFIKSVSLSGTIAKGVMYEESDIDYFIIAKGNRIWLAKFFLKVYKMIFYANSSKELCYNYLLSENTLEIKEKNLYTATEMSTLIPINANATFKRFLEINNWYLDFYPNNNRLNLLAKEFEKEKKEKSFVAKTVEQLLNNSLGDRLDNLIMNRIRKKYQKNYGDELLKQSLKSTKNTSKMHPNDKQNTSLVKYNQKVEQLLNQLNQV